MMYHPQSGWMPAAGQMPGQPDPYAAMYNVPQQPAAAGPNGTTEDQSEGPGVIIYRCICCVFARLLLMYAVQ